jgi:hypothetical protein
VGEGFSIPVQTDTVPHSSSCAMGTGSLFPGIKRSGSGVDHAPSSTSEVRERVELHLYSPSGPSWPIVG